MKSGIINIYKEKGFTSFDVVAKLRGILKVKKIGHTGTLDPQAEGVLPICIGKATKAVSMLTDTDKTYKTTLLLGQATDTYDIYGNVTATKEVNTTPEEVQAVIDSFIGEIDQVPPMYSAIKVNGKRLYELARAGKEVERKPRKVTIYNEETLSIDIPRVTFVVECSKGTYIRSLCNDIGKKLGTLGCMEDLIRTKAGIFTIDNSIRLDEIEKLVKDKRVNDVIIPVDEVFNIYPKRYIKDEFKNLSINGSKMINDQLVESDANTLDSNLYRLYLTDNTFVGLYKRQQDTFILEKMFYEDI